MIWGYHYFWKHQYLAILGWRILVDFSKALVDAMCQAEINHPWRRLLNESMFVETGNQKHGEICGRQELVYSCVFLGVFFWGGG